WLVKVGPAGLESAEYLVFPYGFQTLWEALAAQLDVRYNAEVTAVRRMHPPGYGSMIKLTVTGYDEELTFDRVIISAPLDVVPQFLDVTAEERDLFERVKTNNYYVSIFAAAGLAPERASFIYEN